MHRRIAASMLLLVLLAGCSGATGDPGPNEASSDVPTSRAEPGAVNGKFDVGEYQLYMTCMGTGSPTIVYLHGLGSAGHQPELIGFAYRLSEKHRFCTYDRVNTGESDTHQAQHTGADSVRDLHNLLAAADVRGPHLLLGFSWGGVLATVYAGTYPDEVMGVLLLDSVLPNGEEVDALIPADELKQLQADHEGAEREDMYPTTLDQAKQAARSVPDVPVTFMSARPRNYPPTWPGEEMTPLYQAKLEEFVSQFDQGRLVPVQSSHDVALDQPDLVIAELGRIVSKS